MLHVSCCTFVLLLEHTVKALPKNVFAGKKKAYTALLQCRTFLCRKKNGSHSGKISVVDMAFPGSYRVFVSTTGLESFSLRPEKFSKRFSFSGGCVRFFSSLLWTLEKCPERSSRKIPRQNRPELIQALRAGNSLINLVRRRLLN